MKMQLAGLAAVCVTLAAAAGESVENRLAALEKRVAELERRVGETKTSPATASAERGSREGLREKAKARYEKDVAEYGREAMRDIERLYRTCSKTGDEDALNELLKRYPKANRTGCAVMYAGQRAKGDEAVKWFKKAMADHGDCYYGDGACVGAYARFYLAAAYDRQGKKGEAEKLKDEIRTLYPDAVTHRGRPMKDSL